MHKVIQGQRLAWCGNLKQTFSSAISVNYLQMLFEDLTIEGVAQGGVTLGPAGGDVPFAQPLV